jgi:hypothetical protein
MRRLLATVGSAALVLALTLAPAPVPALAAGAPDPRCAGWEQSGPPPGIDMAAACPPAGPGEADVDLGTEPLVAYIVALLVVAGVLTVFGFVAMRYTAQPAGGRRRADAGWWTCAGCGSPNRPDRGACFACHVSRGEAPTHPA